MEPPRGSLLSCSSRQQVDDILSIEKNVGDKPPEFINGLPGKLNCAALNQIRKPSFCFLVSAFTHLGCVDPVNPDTIIDMTVRLPTRIHFKSVPVGHRRNCKIIHDSTFLAVHLLLEGNRGTLPLTVRKGGFQHSPCKRTVATRPFFIPALQE